MYYRYPYSGRRYRYHSRAARTAPRRSTVSRLYGGIDDDVRRLFFELDPFDLELVFNVYESHFGKGKRKYAETTFAQWQAGTVQMGGDISERLIRIVPEFLSFDQKYHLIEKLWNRLRQANILRVTISPDGGLEAAVTAVIGAIDALADHEIPDTVAERLEWLAQDDAVAAKALLAQVAKREAEVATETLETQLGQLLALASQHHDKIVTATCTVTLPGVIVYITVSQTAATVARRLPMSDENHDKENSAGTPLARRADPEDRQLAPIQNPNDLLGEALRRISPEKQEQIVGTVAEEVARIQVKRAEGHADHEMAASKVETAANAAARLGNTGNEFEVKADHQSEHGSVHVTVRNKPSSIKERLGCFVATACYGDCSHPVVVMLRQFRDQCLRNNAAGRSFIAWYYMSGPVLAAYIAKRPFLQLLGRAALWPVAVAALGATLIVWTTHHRPSDQIAE